MSFKILAQLKLKSKVCFAQLRVFISFSFIVSLIFSLSLVFSFGSLISVEAASAGFNSGTVSIDKYYLNGVSPVKTLTAAPGDFITVRLNYSNTSAISATNVSINDALPSSTFEYIPNTLKNCLIDSTNCVSLNNNSFNGINLSTTSGAGFYSYPSDVSAGNLEFGRLKYLHFSTCSQVSGNKEIFIQSIDNTSIFTPNCNAVAGGSTVISYSSSAILGKRYLHQTTCVYGSGEKEIFTQSVDNSSSFTADCSALSGSSVSSSDTIDLYSPSNAFGYIEYQMKSNIDNINTNLSTDAGNFGTSPTLSSSDFTTLTDNMANSLSLKVYCDQIDPTGGERNLSLSDAELRAGQDFRCDYQAKICPVVFEDANTNGQKNTVETLIPNIVVALKSSDGITTISTITTDMTNQCFENLVHGRNYKLEIGSPPTGANTTGGDTKFKLINYQISQYDALFGYSDGSLNLSVPANVSLPTISVDSKPNDVSTIITPIQVIDTRLSNPGWTLTATTSDFASQTLQDVSIPVSNAFKNSPGSVTVNEGQTNGVNIGDLKTINSVTDNMSIFSGSTGNSKGNYQISTTITLTVPSFSRATSYQSVYTYTII